MGWPGGRPATFLLGAVKCARNILESSLAHLSEIIKWSIKSACAASCYLALWARQRTPELYTNPEAHTFISRTTAQRVYLSIAFLSQQRTCYIYVLHLKFITWASLAAFILIKSRRNSVPLCELIYGNKSCSYYINTNKNIHMAYQGCSVLKF